MNTLYKIKNNYFTLQLGRHQANVSCKRFNQHLQLHYMDGNDAALIMAHSKQEADTD